LYGYELHGFVYGTIVRGTALLCPLELATYTCTVPVRYVGTVNVSDVPFCDETFVTGCEPTYTVLLL